MGTRAIRKKGRRQYQPCHALPLPGTPEVQRQAQAMRGAALGKRRIVHAACEGVKTNVPHSRDTRVCVTLCGGRCASVKGPGGSGQSTQARRLRGPQTRGSVGPKKARVVVPTAAARWVIPESCPTTT